MGGRADGRRRSGVSRWPGAEGKQSGGSASDNHRGKVRQGRIPNRRAKRRSDGAESANGLGGCVDDVAAREDSGSAAPMFAQLNLREKFAEVRRRLGYVQKRGHNERHNYSYVTAADLAGPVGDILAELGVVVIPQLRRSPPRCRAAPPTASHAQS